MFYLHAYENTLPEHGNNPTFGNHVVASIEQLDIAAHTLLDLAKKEVIYCKAVDVRKVSCIVWDLWHLVTAHAWGQYDVRLVDVMAANVSKLEKRYPSGYSNAAAQARADKAGE